MKFLICPDSYKDCMNASTASHIMSLAINELLPQAKTSMTPLSDGGQGFIFAITSIIPHKIISTQIMGPRGDLVTAQYALIDNESTAIIELAQAAGLELLQISERNPYYTTTYGVGELVLHALNQGVQKIILGLGGSATNDGGAGMLQALGTQLLDKSKQELKHGGIYLQELHSICLDTIDKRLKNVIFEIASDVTNPLIGENGATAIFGPQKGATPDMVNNLDAALSNYAKVIWHTCNLDISEIKGGGAAGGVGATLMLFNATMCSGIDLVIKYTNLEEQIINADYIFSGEGSIDEQTIYGKTISGVAKLCHKHSKPLIILTGRSGADLEKLYELGVTAIFPIGNSECDLSTALKHGPDNLSRTVQNIIRLLMLKIP